MNTRLLLAASLLTMCLVSAPARAQDHSMSMAATEDYVRKNAGTAEALPDLEALERAMAKMRSLGCEDPRSWYYQGGIHWVPDEVPKNPLCPSYTRIADLKPAWDNCTHRDGTELHFLIWHRLYIFYLEEIVRSLSGKEDFALPYWDYCNPSHRVMPEVFRRPSSSLHEAARHPSLNKGKPIGPEMDNALDLTKLMQCTSYDIFNGHIDQAPHGAIHNYVGSGLADAPVWNQIYQKKESGLMAEVASAAFDPIFWVHHSNIDYIWQRWMNSPNGAMPDLAELETSPIPYEFFDARGKSVSLSVDDAYRMAFSLPVTYDTFLSPEYLMARPHPNQVAHLAPDRVIRGTRNSFAVKLNVAGDFHSQMESSESGRTILHLVVSMRDEPRGIFEVFVRNNSHPTIEDPEQLAGVMTFFGAKHHAAHRAGHTGGHAVEEFTKEFRFDITDEIETAAFDGKLELHVVRQGGDDTTDVLTLEEINIEHR